MKVRKAAGLILLMALTAASTAAQSQIKLFVTLVDGEGVPVSTVTADEIRIRENGADAKVVKVEPVNGTPKVTLLLDNGSALGQDNLTFLRTGTQALINTLPPTTQIAIYTTAPQPRPLIQFTADRAELTKAIGRLAYDGGVGRFVESVSEAAERASKDKSGSIPTFICLATDSGTSNVQPGIMAPMMKRLQSTFTTVHVIVLANSQGGGVVPEVADAIAKQTGGQFESIITANRLSTLMPEFGVEVAKRLASETGGNFRITAERPKGASGNFGKIEFGAGGKLATKVVLEP